jgi:hypothetical protein
MELITLLKAPAAIAITLIMGYWMIRIIIWIQDKQDQEQARMNRERNE